MMSVLIVILLVIFPGFLTSQNKGEMPIIAYMGVPDERTSDENFKILSECGFTVSIYPYRNADRLVSACRIADKYGVKILGHVPEIESDPEKVAMKLKAEKGFYGYFIKDEPNALQIDDLQKTIKRLKSIDDTHNFYINLQPYTHPGWVPGSMKVDTYPEYLQIASRAECQQISFDHYPILKSGLRDTWYHNLEMIRKESIRKKKPFWAFALSVPHTTPYSDYPAPTMGSLRLQIYSNLAYGAQAIQYFTYWNPGKEEGYNYHDAPISCEGKKTKSYFLVQKMNKELKNVAKMFYGARVTNVAHIGVIPEGCKKLKGPILNIKGIISRGKCGFVVSQFEKDGHKYMAIVNKDYSNPSSIEINTNNKIPQKINTDLSALAVQKKYTIPAGGILIFELN